MSAYITHLTQVSEIQPVIANEDIVSEDNTVIVAKDCVIDEQYLQALKAHKLGKPIELCIRLEEEFTANTIYEIFHQFIQDDTSCQELFAQRDIDEKFVQCIEAFCEFDILRQKLNVLAIQIPDVFEQSLFCGFHSVTMLAQENYTQQNLNEAFIASLSHDLGLLEVEPDILFKTSPLSAEEWQTMQQHPQHGANLLSSLNDIDKQCVRAVLEHHESIDGTGYPKGKFEKQLCDLGRVIHTLDSINAIYRKNFKSRGRSLRDMIPIMEMNTLSRGDHFTESLKKLFSNTSPTEHCTLDETLLPQAIEMMKANIVEIQHFISITSQFTRTVGSKHKDIKVLTVQNIAHLIKATLSSCGIINEAYLRWLEQVETEKLVFAYRELEDVLFMTQEIKFHIVRCKRQISIFLAQQTNTPLHEAMEKLLAEIDNIATHEISTELLDYLNGKTVGE